MKKKIGICTLWFANNYGAILQALSLQKVLTELGYDVEFIKFKDFEPCEKDENIEMFNISKKSLNIAEKIFDKDIHDYDAIVIGSDEMWNVKNETFEHLEEYLGHNLNCNKIISYAPSANGVTAEELKEFHGEKANFDNLHYLSARDKKTKKMLEDITQKEVKLVLDPTMLVESFEEYIKYPPENIKDYIVIYGYNFFENEKNDILEFADKQNKKIYSLAFNHEWCKTINGDVSEFLGYIKNADYVITNTFHGTLFSTILEKEFAIYIKGNHKIEDVAMRLDFIDRAVTEKNKLCDILARKVDYDKINKIKKKEKEESLKYLVDSIG